MWCSQPGWNCVERTIAAAIIVGPLTATRRVVSAPGADKPQLRDYFGNRSDCFSRWGCREGLPSSNREQYASDSTVRREVALRERGAAQDERYGDPQPTTPAAVLAQGDNRSEHAEVPPVRRGVGEIRRSVCLAHEGPDGAVNGRPLGVRQSLTITGKDGSADPGDGIERRIENDVDG